MIAAAALVVGGTAVAVGAASETDTVQLCRTTKSPSLVGSLAGVPAGTVTWPVNGACPSGTERFDVAAPSAATALGERLTGAEAEITTLKQENGDRAAEIERLEGALREAFPAKLTVQVVPLAPGTGTMTVTGSGLKPGAYVRIQYAGASEPIPIPLGTVGADGRFSYSDRQFCPLFPVKVSTQSWLGEPVEARGEFPCAGLPPGS